MGRASDTLLGTFLSPRFRRFVLVGGVAAAANVGSRALCGLFMPFGAAVACAYVTGMVTAYLLVRRFVFEHARSTYVESSLRFIAVNMLAAAQTYFVSWMMRSYVLPQVGLITYRDLLAHMAGVAAPVFTSFLAHLRWTFAK